MTTFFGAIADDFTGATDLAALLARSGLPVSLRIDLPSTPPGEDVAALEIIALKCRTAPVDQAVAEAKAALNWLQMAGAQRVYWKYCSTFDSRPEGNIGPIAEALMEALGAQQTVYCPAFPENGRAVFMGHLFVGESLLSDSPMKDHPLTPMRDSSLLRLLAPQVSGRVGLASRPVVSRGPQALRAHLADLAKAGIGHVILDAVSAEDLQCLAAACCDLPLLTGGSAFAAPLPALWQAQGLIGQETSAKARSHPSGPALVLAGSCSAMTREQVADFIALGHPAYRIDPLDLAQNGIAPALDWLRQQDPDRAPMLYATASPESVREAQQRLGTAKAGALVEEALAAAALAARDLGYRSFLVAGGETSGAVTRALGIDKLDIGAEIAPGVPWCYASSGSERLALTLKSGNFGQKRFFTEALGKAQG